MATHEESFFFTHFYPIVLSTVIACRLQTACFTSHVRTAFQKWSTLPHVWQNRTNTSADAFKG